MSYSDSDSECHGHTDTHTTATIHKYRVHSAIQFCQGELGKIPKKNSQDKFGGPRCQSDHQ